MSKPRKKIRHAPVFDPDQLDSIKEQFRSFIHKYFNGSQNLTDQTDSETLVIQLDKAKFRLHTEICNGVMTPLSVAMTAYRFFYKFNKQRDALKLIAKWLGEIGIQFDPEEQNIKRYIRDAKELVRISRPSQARPRFHKSSETLLVAPAIKEVSGLEGSTEPSDIESIENPTRKVKRYLWLHNEKLREELDKYRGVSRSLAKSILKQYGDGESLQECFDYAKQTKSDRQFVAKEIRKIDPQRTILI